MAVVYLITIYLPAFRDTQACPEGLCTNGTQVPCEVPSLPNPTTRKGWPHHWGLRPLLFLISDVGSFTSHKNKSEKVLWYGTYGFSSLSEKTRNNHLQMSLQKQHFLLSYLNTLSVGPAGLNPRPPTQQNGALPTDLTRRRSLWPKACHTNPASFQTCSPGPSEQTMFGTERELDR